MMKRGKGKENEWEKEGGTGWRGANEDSNINATQEKIISLHLNQHHAAIF